MLQTRIGTIVQCIENWLESERDQLALWVPVLLGSGIAAWFVLPYTAQWIGVIASGLALAALAPVAGIQTRLGRALLVGGLCVALGCGLSWSRAVRVAAARLDHPQVVRFSARVERIELRIAAGEYRLWLRPDADSALPRLVRVSATELSRVPLPGDHAVLRARLVPPPSAGIPDGYDFARSAWFLGLGAVGRTLGRVELGAARAGAQDGLRARLARHVRAQISGSAGGIAAAFASGDRGGIAPEDENAMRASGLTHLLSISGLHVSAMVATAMFLTLRLLAWFPTLALRWPLVPIAAGSGALAGIGYTLLTGAEVPTIRSCIAAVLVVAGMALGREALTLRLVATGALALLLLWPEVLIGPSFQLSFAAITALVALHENAKLRDWLGEREIGVGGRALRLGIGLLVSGLAVELALAPIALFHFHRAGLYGALANIIAIPLTTFIIMPLEALALLLDPLRISAPFWWLAGGALNLLLDLARLVAALPGALVALPAAPVASFAVMVAGGLWLMLWRTPSRWFGLAPLLFGLGWALASRAPDLLLTGDGRHLIVRDDRGSYAMLRPRGRDFVRSMLGERAGTRDWLWDIDDARGARCSVDVCQMMMTRGGRVWSIVATRSGYDLPRGALINLCRSADIIVSERWLPNGCQPRWLKLDHHFLAQSGGIAVFLGDQPRLIRERVTGDAHPWISAPPLAQSARRRSARLW